MSEDQPECEYARVRISGTLICTSDLHVGDGDLKPFKEFRCSKNEQHAKGEKEKEKEKEKKEAGSYNSVCLDHNKRAYIPGSTLRGALTAFLNKDHKTIKKLFGYEKPAGKNQDGERSAGNVRVFDAHIEKPIVTDGDKTIVTDGDKTPYWNPCSGTFISHGIALDDITGTAAKGKLFRYELVPAGTEFSVELEADCLTQTQVKQLLGLLARWNGSAETAIGKGASKGYGRVEWKNSRVGVLKKKTLREWAANSALSAPYFKPAEILPDDVTKLLEPRKRHVFTIRIMPQSPLLCNEPGFVTGIEQEPKLVFQARNGKAIIPGTTLAGAARARGRKILMTLLHQAKPDAKLNDLAEQADVLIKQLFGSEEQKSAIEFSDATDTATATVKHAQYFNAIDRFTGGVKDSALFNVTAAQCDTLITESCSLNSDRMPKDDNWWKGLLLFIARDAIEGELAVGWGKGKGYGSFTVAIEYQGHSISSTDDLINATASQFGEKEVGIWIKALSKALSNEINTRIQIEGVVA